MRYKAVRDLKAEAFKRLTGVRPQVFADMVAVLQEGRKQKSGRTSKLCLEAKLLLAMSYWR